MSQRFNDISVHRTSHTHTHSSNQASRLSNSPSATPQRTYPTPLIPRPTPCLANGNPNIVPNKQQGRQVCEMLRKQVFKRYSDIVESTDEELAEVLVQKTMKQHKDAIFYDDTGTATGARWFIFDSTSGWITRHSDHEIQSILKQQLEHVHCRFLHSVRHAHRKAREKGMYDSMAYPGVMEVIHEFSTHTKHLQKQIDNPKFMKKCLERVCEMFRTPAISSQFDSNQTVLGCFVNGNTPALFDCNKRCLITDEKMVKKGNCCRKLGMPPPLSSLTNSFAKDVTLPIAFGSELSQTMLLFLQTVLRDAILKGSCSVVQAVQISGGGAQVLIDLILRTLGEYAMVVINKKQSQTIPQYTRVVVCNNDRIAVRCLENVSRWNDSSRPLIIYNSSKDLTTSCLLYNNSASRFVHIRDSGRTEDSIDLKHCQLDLWSWLLSENVKLEGDSSPEIPKELAKQSDPTSQHNHVLNEYLKESGYYCDYCDTADGCVKQILKLSVVSENVHAFAKRLGYRSMLITQQQLHELLEDRCYKVTRPAGTRQVIVFAVEKQLDQS